MAKYLDSSVTVAALNVIKNGATRLILCSGIPTNYGDITTKTLATKTITATGWTASNGVLTIPAITSISITNPGNVRTFVLTDGASIMYAVNYCGGSTDGTTGGTAVTAGQLWDLATCTLTIAQPT